MTKKLVSDRVLRSHTRFKENQPSKPDYAAMVGDLYFFGANSNADNRSQRAHATKARHIETPGAPIKERSKCRKKAKHKGIKLDPMFENTASYKSRF